MISNRTLAKDCNIQILKHVNCLSIVFLSIFAYSEADRAGDVQNRKPVTGMVINLNESDSPLFWRTAEQRSVSLFKCKSEYMALSALAQEFLFLKHVFESVNYNTTPMLLSDNQGAICVAHETAQN